MKIKFNFDYFLFLMKPKVVKYAQGAGEAGYLEVIHASPAKVEKIKKILNVGEENGYELNIEAIMIF